MTDPIVKAVVWAGQLLAGPAATSACILAVASIGMAMLVGRIDSKRALTCLIGCFVIFGATSIATALSTSVLDTPSPIGIVATDPVLDQPSQSSDFDPYAGASPLPRSVSKEEIRRRAAQ